MAYETSHVHVHAQARLCSSCTAGRTAATLSPLQRRAPSLLLAPVRKMGCAGPRWRSVLRGPLHAATSQALSCLEDQQTHNSYSDRHGTCKAAQPARSQGPVTHGNQLERPLDLLEALNPLVWVWHVAQGFTSWVLLTKHHASEHLETCSDTWPGSTAWLPDRCQCRQDTLMHKYVDLGRPQQPQM